MSKSDLRCSECHKYAPSGVCMGPHPRFDERLRKQPKAQRAVAR